MATIEKLNRSITQMIWDEALALVQAIRRSRQVVKKVARQPAAKKETVAKVAKAAKTKKAPATTADILAAMTDEQKAKLIAMLKGGDGK